MSKICKGPVTEVTVDLTDSQVAGKRIESNYCCVFLVAGRMIYRKGLDLLLDAVIKIPQDMSYQVRVVGDGPELKSLRAKCKSNSKLLKHLHFMGAVPYTEMEKEYMAANVFIMPSIRETTGTVLLEAMAKGIPIITINKFGGAVLLDNSCAWLYEGESRQDYINNLAECMMQCIENPDDVIRKGVIARSKAEMYTWEEKNKFYQKIYDELLKG